jgi:hypothetical protein
LDGTRVEEDNLDEAEVGLPPQGVLEGEMKQSESGEEEKNALEGKFLRQQVRIAPTSCRC